MVVDVTALKAQMEGQFEDGAERLTVPANSILAPLVAEHVLGLPLHELTDDLFRKVVLAALDMASAVDPAAPAARAHDRAAAKGAIGFFHLDGGPPEQWFTDIQLANSQVDTVTCDSQACRFSWARWNEQFALRGKAVASNEKNGRIRKSKYAEAVTNAIVDGLNRPRALRAAVENLTTRSAVVWSQFVEDFLAASRAHARDLAIDPGMYVVRAIESELLEKMTDLAHCWPRAIVGEAGSGKSTLMWSLFSSLAQRPGLVPVLLSATWMVQHTEPAKLDQLLGAFEEIQRAGRTPVLLLDTIDLMLHDEVSRQYLHRLIDATVQQVVPAVYSTRPQECAALHVEDLRRHELSPYDDDELDQAVITLVPRYCPHADHVDVARRIRDANARGLPVADVCRSPLLLRMLFDLASPDEPELQDVDVSRLFDDYWERRVRRDARLEPATAFHVDPAHDLSAILGHAGVGLLASGTPELPLSALELSTTASAAAVEVNGRSVCDSLDILRERGTLVTNGDLVGFFHQTMFEFAAAKGLLAASRSQILRTLAGRTTDRGGDLFVGAVLEQTLILAGRSPLLKDAAQGAVRAALTSESPAVQAIGLVAWAHHPVLLPDAGKALSSAGTVALERAARILPSIAGKRTGQTISQLMLVWRASDTPRTRAVVLGALTRLASRAPGDVAEALVYLDPVAALRGFDDVDDLHRSLLAALRAVSEVARQFVRATLVAMLTAAPGATNIELDYLAEQWHHIGDEHLLNEVLRSVPDDGRYRPSVPAGLAKIQAAEWKRSGAWRNLDEWKAFVSEVVQTDQPESRLMAETMLCSLHQFILDMGEGDRRISPVIEALLDTDNALARDVATQIVIRELFWSESHAGRTMMAVAKESLETVGYGAQRSRITDRQNMLLDVIAQSQLPDGLRRDLLPSHLIAQDWLADGRLLRLVALAADDGVISALELLEQMSLRPTAFSAEQLGQVFGAHATRMCKRDDVFDALLSIAIQTHRVSELERMITTPERHDPRVSRNSPRILAYARQLLAGDVTLRHRGASILGTLMGQAETGLAWEDLRTILDSVDDPDSRKQLIRNLWKRTGPENVGDQIAYLSEFVQVSPDAQPPITRHARQPPVDISTATVCTEAMLRILTLRSDTSIGNWPAIRTLGLHELENPDVYVTGTRLVVVCAYLTDLGRSHAPQASRFLVEYLRRLTTGEFFSIELHLWRRELREVVFLACTQSFGEVMGDLIDLCASLDDELAQVITEAITERHYVSAKGHLQHLIQEGASPALKRFLTDLIRTHDRSFGTREFPEILAWSGEV